MMFMTFQLSNERPEYLINDEKDVIHTLRVHQHSEE